MTPGDRVRARFASRHPVLVATPVFLAVSLVLFAHVLALSPTRAATCTCSDVSQFAWFIEWVWVAVAHGHDPFFSRAMFYPQGVNVLDNTSATGLGFLLLPITGIFGPLAALNVALVAAPVASAASFMVMARRFAPAPLPAALAALLYGFGPLTIFHSVLGHLNVTFLAIPPLVVVGLDELLWRRTRRPVPVGLALAALLVWQFFCSSELFVECLLLGALGLVVLALGARLSGADVVGALRAARPGLLAGAGLAVALLAAPVAFALAGPSHFAGPVWPGRVLSDANLRSLFEAASATTLWWQHSAWHFLQPVYLAPGLVVGLLVGVVVWRRDRRLLALLALAAISAALSIGPGYSWSPWHLLGRMPILQNVVNDRFGALTALFALTALVVVAGHLATATGPRVGPWLAAGLIVLAGFPYVDDAVHVAPYAAERVWIPTWYAEHAGSLPAGQVILGFPFFDATADLLSVQAIYEMRYSVVGGTTAQWLDSRQGREAPGYRVIWNLASTRFGRHMASVPSPVQTREVAAALAGWGVTLVVVPMRNGPTVARVARAPAFVEHWLAAIIGTPSVQSGAWVWRLAPARAV